MSTRLALAFQIGVLSDSCKRFRTARKIVLERVGDERDSDEVNEKRSKPKALYLKELGFGATELSRRSVTGARTQITTRV